MLKLIRVFSVLDPFKLNQQFRASKSQSHIPTPAGVFLGLAVLIVTLAYFVQRIDVLINRRE
jgi:hypothetical protein